MCLSEDLAYSVGSGQRVRFIQEKSVTLKAYSGKRVECTSLRSFDCQPIDLDSGIELTKSRDADGQTVDSVVQI